MNTTTLAGHAGRFAGTTARILIHEVDWAEVADLVIDCLKVAIVMALLAGRYTRRAWDALPGISEQLGRWYSRRLVAARATYAPVAVAARVTADRATSLARLTNRQLMVLAGTRRRLPKAQLIQMVMAA
jgi:hypothetical protein